MATSPAGIGGYGGLDRNMAPKSPQDSIHTALQVQCNRVWGMVQHTQNLLNRLHGSPPQERGNGEAKIAAEPSTMQLMSDLSRAIAELETNVERLVNTVG